MNTSCKIWAKLRQLKPLSMHVAGKIREKNHLQGRWFGCILKAGLKTHRRLNRVPNESPKGESYGSLWQKGQGTKGTKEEAQTYPQGKEEAEAREGTAGRKETHHHPWIGKRKNTHRAGQCPGSILFGEAADAARLTTDPKPAPVRKTSTIPDGVIHNSSTIC